MPTAPKPTIVATVPEQRLSAQGMIDPVLSMLERVILDTSIPIERVQEAWRMRREYETEISRRSFNQAMANVHQAIGQVDKDRANPITQSRYATLSAMDAAARPIYSANGFSLSYNTAAAQAPGNMRQVLIVKHRDGHQEQHEIEAPLDSVGIRGQSNKTGVQAIGSTATYLRRYLLMMALNIVVSQDPDDDDGARSRPAQSMRDYAERMPERAPPAAQPERKTQTADEWVEATITALAAETTQAAKISRLLLRIEPFSVEQLERLLAHDGWKRLIEAQFPPDQAALQAAADERVAGMKQGRDAAKSGK